MQKILVVDDSKMIRMRVKDMLPADKLEIIEAKDGKEGLDKIYSEQPQLIILDFLLPKKSGWEVYQEIQSHAELKFIPLVLMSGRKEEVTEKISEPFSHFAFVEKPFQREQLVQAIKDARSKAPKPEPKPPVAAAVASAAEGDEVAALKAKVAELTTQLETTQGEVKKLQKQFNQLVNYVKNKLS